MAAKAKMVGLRFARLVVLKPAPPMYGGRLAWLCRCDCGAKKVVFGEFLRSGATRSCGCVRVEIAVAVGRRNREHGLWGHPLYDTWRNMIARCENPEHRDFRYYGKKGITVCRRWRRSLRAFISDVGPRPNGKSLDRYPDRSGDYKPSNVRWATARQQRINQDRYGV